MELTSVFDILSDSVLASEWLLNDWSSLSTRDTGLYPEYAAWYVDNGIGGMLHKQQTRNTRNAK